METRLTVELVPSTCWYTNVRSHVTKAVWDRLRRQVTAEAGNRCEICGGRAGAGRSNATKSGITTTTGRSSGSSGSPRAVLACHEVKHAGLASRRGRLSAVIAHLADVNGWSAEDAELYLEAVFETWAARSRHRWTLHISLLSTRYGIDSRPKRTPTRLIPSHRRFHCSNGEATPTRHSHRPAGPAMTSG